MRVHGRTLRPTTVDERHLLLRAGVASLHIPRHENPFRVARQIEQFLKRQHEQMAFLHRLARTHPKSLEPQPSPGLDLPHHEQDHAVAT